MSEPAKTRPERWREFYNDALRDSGDRDVRQSKVHLAISLCLLRAIELAPERSAEREAISTALHDLKIIRDLSKKGE
jgi:hypothetical protein